MTTNISKIRDEKLTEDEKMELIADYLENGGGGGSSKLRIKINVNYVPTSASELQYVEGEGVGAYNVVDPQYISVQDEKGNPVSVDTLRENIANGNVEIIDVDHLGEQAVIDGDNVTLVPREAHFSSIPTGTASIDGVADVVVGQIKMIDSAGTLTAGLTIAGGGMIAVVGVFIS